MTDPKVLRLATAIAEALSALVDLAKDGEPILYTAGAESIEERPTPAPDAPPATRKRQAKPASAGDASSASAKETSSPTVEENPEAEVADEEPAAPTLGDARKLAVDLAKAKGRAGLLDVLTQFGAAGVSALEPDQIADFCDACRESLAA